MNTENKAYAMLLGALLAGGLAGCKDRTEDQTPAPVTQPDTTAPATTPVTPDTAPVTPATPPSDTTTPPPDTTTPPAGGTSGTSGTEGTTGAGQPSSTAPDRTDNKEPQRDRPRTY